MAEKNQAVALKNQRGTAIDVEVWNDFNPPTVMFGRADNIAPDSVGMIYPSETIDHVKYRYRDVGSASWSIWNGAWVHEGELEIL